MHGTQPPAAGTHAPAAYLDASQPGDRRPSSAPVPRGPRWKDGLPDAPTTFPELQAMPLKDLRLLHDEKAKFDDFVSKHAHQKVVDEFVGRIKGEVERLKVEHEAITERMEEVANEEGLAGIRERIVEMEKEATGLQKLKDEWLEQNSPERLIERLKMAIAEEESNSEMLEKRMVSSSMSFDGFLVEYIACRKKYHERSLKLEQLKQESRKRSYGR